MPLDVPDTTDSPGCLHRGGYQNYSAVRARLTERRPTRTSPSSDTYRAQRRKIHNSADTTAEITMHVTIGK
jgi:hypothetical protein